MLVVALVIQNKKNNQIYLSVLFFRTDKYLKNNFMKSIKIFKLVLLGFLILNIPIIVGFLFCYYYVDANNQIYFLLLLSIVGFFYWSFAASWYRLHSINNISTPNEYFLWKKLTINFALLWPDNFLLTKFEFWDDSNHFKYINKLNKILNNEISK